MTLCLVNYEISKVMIFWWNFALHFVCLKLFMIANWYAGIYIIIYWVMKLRFRWYVMHCLAALVHQGFQSWMHLKYAVISSDRLSYSCFIVFLLICLILCCLFLLLSLTDYMLSIMCCFRVYFGNWEGTYLW